MIRFRRTRSFFLNEKPIDGYEADIHHKINTKFNKNAKKGEVTDPNIFIREAQHPVQ